MSKERHNHTWRGKRLGDMGKEELIDTLIESNTKLTEGVRKQIKNKQEYIDFIKNL